MTAWRMCAIVDMHGMLNGPCWASCCHGPFVSETFVNKKSPVARSVLYSVMYVCIIVHGSFSGQTVG